MRHQTRFSGLALSVCLGLMGLSGGCGKETPEAPPASTKQKTASTENANPTAANPAPDSKVTLADLDAVTKAKEPFKIVLIVKTRNNPFFQPMIAAFEQAAKELGAVGEVQSPAQETDKEKQFALVQSEVSKGVKAICITPADSRGIVPALRAAQKAGVLVINLDNRIDAETGKAQGLTSGGYVGADNVAGGRLAGETMVELLGGKGKVAILEGIRGVDNAESRKRGFTEAITGKLEVAASETAEWDKEKAYKQTQNILARNPDIQGIFCANDMMAIGALTAINEAGKAGKIVVIGYDNIPEVKDALAKKTLAATIEQHPDLMGKYGLKMAVGILNGSVPAGGDIMVPLEVIKSK